MTLLVRTPPGYETERRYVLEVVVDRWWGLGWTHRVEDRSDVRLEIEGEADDAAVSVPDVLFATPPDRWLTPGSLPPRGGPWLRVGVSGSDVLAPDEQLPRVYGAHPPAEGAAARDGHPPGTVLLEEDEGTARLHVDVFGSVFFMLTRYEELVLTARDRYDRFPASAALAQRESFLRVPIVDAYVELLWAACARVWPRLRRRRHRYRVRLTHDVDDPLSTLGRGRAEHARQLAGDVVRRRDPRLLGRRVRALAAASRGNHASDPNNTFDFLMDTSERHGVRSAFYFLAGRELVPGGGHVDLVGHPWVQGLVGRVHRRGHEVGFHAGDGTYLDADRTRREFDRLRVIAERAGVDQDRWGGRQHYLQWSNPVTWRNWAAAGLDHDSTLAFSDAVGFRTGTCRDYPVFDLVERRPLALVETPFQVMDVTLFGYMSLGPDEAREATLEIARACRRFGGTFGLLWHNDSVLRTGREKRWYSSLVEATTTL